MGRRSRRRRRTRAANTRARARSIAKRRGSSVVKKKTPTTTRRTIARLRTPITRKAPITKTTTSRSTRRKITSTARKTRRKTVAAKPVVPTAAQRKRARSKTTVRRRIVNKATQVKRNKRDRGFTKVTRVPTTFRPAVPVSRRAGRIVTRPRIGLDRLQSGPRLSGELGGGRFTRDDDFNLRDRDLVLAGNTDRDGVIGGGNIPGGPAQPVIIPNVVPSNPKDVVVTAITYLNGKRIDGALLKENGNTDGTRSPASRRYNIKQLLGNGKTFTAELNNATSDQYYTIRAVVKNETITTQVPVPPDDFVSPSITQ